MPFDDGELTHLERLGASVQVELTPLARSRFSTYFDLLVLWNRTVSLVSTATPRDLVERHAFDSLHVVPLISPNATIIDLGSGAGFPAIPLAIVRPDCRVTMIESRRKKANFLREVSRRAELVNTSVFEGRAEDHQPEVKATVVTARALAETSTLLRLARPLLTPGGIVIAMKGPSEAEPKVDPALRFTLIERREYELPAERSRVLLVFRFD